MWNHLVDHMNGDLKSGLFVGDAAGRADSEGKRREFADSDLKFAESLGLPFKTPDEMFMHHHPAESDEEEPREQNE